MLKILIACILCFASSASEARTYSGNWSLQRSKVSEAWLKTAQTKNRIKFQLEVSRGAPSFNTGFIEGAFTLIGNRGAFKSTEYGACTIDFNFEKSKLVITQGGTCGFGYGVFADGEYKRKSYVTPRFCTSNCPAMS